MLISDEFAPLRVREREQHMHNTHERHLDQIEEQLLGIEVTLSEKLDRVDLEYQLSEGVVEITSKLEEIHDDLREVHGELEDVKFKLDYPPDRQD